MNTKELRAIAGADHMVSTEADKHDFDGWYRNTIRQLLDHIAQGRELQAVAWDLGFGVGYVEGHNGAAPSAPKPLNPFKQPLVSGQS